MFRLGKEMEYALIGLVEMSRHPEGLISARALSERYHIPYKILARALQKLSAGGIVEAEMGPRGGYRLHDDPQNIRLGSILRAVRGDEKVVDCLDDQGNCAQELCGCTIKPLMEVFQERWITFVENTSLAEFVNQGNTAFSLTGGERDEELAAAREA